MEPFLRMNSSHYMTASHTCEIVGYIINRLMSRNILVDEKYAAAIQE